jgi:biotin carboxylase
MYNKSILIFGAGINQLELIKEAKNLGVHTIVIDPCANPVGKELADVYYQIDGLDYRKTKEIALKHKVDGIITGQMENPLRLMAKLAKELKLVFHSPEVIENCLNKGLMKEVFIKSDIKCAKGKVYKSSDTITQESLSEFQFPLIIKPSDAFSSRGVLKVDSFEEIYISEIETRSYSTTDSIIVEEFLVGKEFSVECITFKGNTDVIQVTEKFITPYPYAVEMGHLQPARITEAERNDIECLVKKAIRSLNIDNSASHAEVILTSEGPYMIEIGARLGGDFISSHLTKASTGVSMDRASIQIAIGLKPSLQKIYNRYSMIKYIDLEVGRKVEKLLPLDDLYKSKSVVFAYYFIKEGDTIKKITNSAHRPTCILIQSDNIEVLFNTVKSKKKSLKSKILTS